jgi:hypothetical protein
MRVHDMLDWIVTTVAELAVANTAISRPAIQRGFITICFNSAFYSLYGGAMIFKAAITCIAASFFGLFGLVDTISFAGAETPRIKIAFEGDSMVDGIWEGMVRFASHNACLRQAFDFGRFTKNSTGLTRVDKFNWPEESKRIAESYAPDLVIITMGLNDRQSVIAADHTHAVWGAIDWPAKYGEQIKLLLDSASVAKFGVLWLGVPALRDPESNKDAAEKNAIYSTVIATLGKDNIAFVPPWRLNPTGEEIYKSTGPDLNGNIVQLRLNDGEHFTTAGHDLIGVYMFPKVLAHLTAQGVTLPEGCLIH